MTFIPLSDATGTTQIITSHDQVGGEILNNKIIFKLKDMALIKYVNINIWLEKKYYML